MKVAYKQKYLNANEKLKLLRRKFRALGYEFEEYKQWAEQESRKIQYWKDQAEHYKKKQEPQARKKIIETAFNMINQPKEEQQNETHNRNTTKPNKH